MSYLLLRGDAGRIPLADGSIHCVVTSPPYWGAVRDYGSSSHIGMEREPSSYVAALVAVFREVRRVLNSRGTLWLNVGDVYAAGGKGGGGSMGDRPCWESIAHRKGWAGPPPGFKRKDLTLVAFGLADALRRDGWYLRSTIIWRKWSAVEAVRVDRPAVSHEYLFLFAASETYDARDPGEPWWHHTVWDIGSEHFPGHPAAMPTELARRCIASGCPDDGIVFDPFSGSGSTGYASRRLGRRYVGSDLNAEYLELSSRRLADALRPVSRLDPRPAYEPGNGQLSLFAEPLT